MKLLTRFRPLRLAAAVCVMAAVTSPVMAEKGDLTASLKYGKSQPDGFSLPGQNGVFSVDPDGDTAFGVALGYEYDENWTAELVYTSGEGSDDTFRTPIKTEYTSIGLLGVYRSQIELASPYFIGKIGMTKTDVDISQGNFGETESGTKLSYGAGAGYQYSEQLAFEAEYFVPAKDVAYLLVGVRFHFGS